MKGINSIIEFHKLLSLPEPLHPQVSVVDIEKLYFTNDSVWKHFFLDFYTISVKKGIKAKVKYGQQYYDYDSGVMSFTAPKQVKSIELSDQKTKQKESSGHTLMFHPDFLGKHPLASLIKDYSFFSYSLNEALHLSEKEENDILEIIKKINKECHHIDNHTQDIVLSQLETLLHYSNRFYERQFLTRKTVNDDLLIKMERLLNTYFAGEKALQNGLPTVEYLANELHLSPHYLSDMLRSITGQNAQQHIHEKLIEKAKEKLSTTTLSVGEIAYHLGFEYPQSFNKLFKNKTNLSPLEFRNSFS